MTTYIAKSKIHGRGVFASKNISSGDLVGVAVLGINPLKRTEIGRLINHAGNANSVLKKNDNVFNLFASKNIKKGDEVTVNYYQAEKELKIPIDTSFLLNQNKNGASMEKTHLKIKLSKRDDLLDFDVLEPITEDIVVLKDFNASKEDETTEVDTGSRIKENPLLGAKKTAPKPDKPIFEEVIEPLDDVNVEELENILKELEAVKKRPLISKRARRRGVEKEYVWMYVNGRLLVDKNVEGEKEIIGVGHVGLANRARVNPKYEFPRGFVTYYTNGDIEVQTYGINFWEMPTRIQNIIEKRFELSPGKYKVERPLSLPPGTRLLLANQVCFNFLPWVIR